MHVIYIDESSFHRNIGSSYAYSKKGERIKLYSKFANKHINIVTAISKFGLEGVVLREASTN